MAEVIDLEEKRRERDKRARDACAELATYEYMRTGSVWRALLAAALLGAVIAWALDDQPKKLPAPPIA